MNTVAKNSVLHFINNKSKMLWILLFFSAMAWAQPNIANPTPYQVCDDNNDGFAGFELFTKDAEILGTNAASDYTVSYHASLTDAQNNINILWSTYTNNTAYNQTVYVRVQENANPSNFATTTLDLIVHDKPIAATPADYHLCELTLGSNTAVFDLTTLNVDIINGNAMPPHTIHYYEVQASAVPGNTNAIGTPSVYTVTGSQTIWALLENTVTGCYDVVAVNLVVDPLPIVPASGAYPALETCETGAPLGIETFNLAGAIPTILNGQTGVSVTFYPSLSDAYNGTNVITTLGAYTNTVPYVQTLSIALTNTTTGCTSYATMDLVINPQPTVLNPTIPMEVCDDNNDGYVTFDLSQADTHIVDSVSPTTQTIQYYATQTDAEMNIGGLSNSYTNNAVLPVTIYARVEENVTGCYTIAPLELRALNCNTIVLSKDGTLDKAIVAPSDVANVGDIINYTFTVNNYSAGDFSSVSVSDPLVNTITYVSGNVNMDNVLNPNETWIYTATYTITQADIDAGFVYNQATVSGVDSNSVPVTSQSTDPTPCYACPNPNQITGVTIVPLGNIIYAGNTNTISGHINFDYDNNGCTTTDTPASYMPILVQSTAQQFYTYANYDGSYTVNVPQGNYTITPQLQWNQPGFVANPTSANVNFAANNYLTATQDFCISVATPITDVEVGTYFWNSLRPGFNSYIIIYYRNIGNQIVSGNVSFNFDASHLDFLSVTPIGTVSGGTVTFNYSNLLPGQIEYAYVYLRTHSPTDTLAVNIGETYPFSVAITPATDANPSSNSMSFNATVVGSYDPNNIICTEGNQLPPSEIGNYLHYTVNFENTGNYPADFVNVRIPIDSNLYDVNSLEIVGTSHHFQPKLQNNILDVLFPNIMLDTGGHGNVLLKIKSKNTLQAGDMVYKHAEIYFDYNTPVDTGYANTVYQTLASQIIEQDNLVTIYPNPATTNITIAAQNELQKIELYDVQGRLVLEKICENEKQTTLDVSTRAAGLYFIKITTDKGSKLEKWVKE